ncbi:MAG: dihydrolipoamide acetyltransferase family protein [Thermodesulfovibrionales bacterium]
MPYDFALPDLGEGITEGEIRKWLVREGDQVEEHQPVLEVETDKAVVEVPSPRKGRVARLAKEEGEMAAVGEVLMTIALEGEEEEAVPAPRERPRKESVSVVGELPEEEPGEKAAREKREVLATPGVRARARDLGVDLSKVRGTGPGGSVREEDLERAGSAPAGREEAADAYGPVEAIPVRGLRRSIAKNLLAVLHTYASVTGMEDADVTELWELREREKAAVRDKGVHLTFMPFFIKAVQHAVAFHPYMNASYDEEGGRIVLKKYFHVGIATDTPDGLMVPVIRDADKKTIMELAVELEELTRKARDRKIKLDELRGNSFTITNYGSFGGTYATPIINAPDCAILGAGRIVERPWVKDGKVAIRKILHLSLTFDHRVTDGADAARFLTRVRGYLEDPARIFLESS